MKIVEAKEARERLTMPVCIELMRDALAQLEAGNYTQPLRSISLLPGGEKFGFMPAWLGDCYGAKVVSACPRNAGTGYPSHIGYVLLFESEHSCFEGMADASVITEVRTGAVSAVATDLLARKDAHTLAVIGAGAQGRSHLAAMKEVREITSVRVFDQNKESMERYCREMSALHKIPVTPAESVEEAVAEADIICTVTPSKEPYLKAQWIKPGTHINAVGAFTPTAREVCSDLIAKAKLYADQVEAMKKECGEYLIPLAEGVIGEEHIQGSIGEILLGKVKGREKEDEITLFDALGLAVEDVACARFLCKGNIQ
ncbi:MAG: ornithine cyclodeaminase family protein [Lachnospiraceae bacterium]|nr:ornithine cyclodeaminase family protein [Robinsoniella sp.]MDY3766899.1 ornithine cyclodeaminase family protein [Lachnospiraceae bacterium]